MRKIILFMHISLDGFATDKDGGMGWISVSDEIFDMAGQMTDQSDTGLYGRVTFQLMESYWPGAGSKPNATKHDIEHSAWYSKVHKVVLSRTMKTADNPGVQIIGSNLEEEILKIKSQPGKNIIIFGSPSAGHSLAQLNLIDEYWLFVNPVLLGEGNPVFKKTGEITQLKLSDTKVFDSGVVALHYIVER